MDGFYPKDAFIGFKVEQSFKNDLLDAARRKGFKSLSKFIIFICRQYLKTTV